MLLFLLKIRKSVAEAAEFRRSENIWRKCRACKWRMDGNYAISSYVSASLFAIITYRIKKFLCFLFLYQSINPVSQQGTLVVILYEQIFWPWLWALCTGYKIYKPPSMLGYDVQDIDNDTVFLIADLEKDVDWAQQMENSNLLKVMVCSFASSAWVVHI